MVLLRSLAVSIHKKLDTVRSEVSAEAYRPEVSGEATPPVHQVAGHASLHRRRFCLARRGIGYLGHVQPAHAGASQSIVREPSRKKKTLTSKVLYGIILDRL
jgi:hypothetical protein